MKIRIARQEDAAAISDIYAPIVRDTTISFEWEAPSKDEMSRRISKTLGTHPWLVAETENDVTAYAYATAHRSRTAYQWSCEVSVYVSAEHTRRGQARRLYEVLFDLLRRQNCVTAYAGITQPNDPSIGFHKSMGFEHIGTYRNVGYKHGAWRDVSWMGKSLQVPTVPHALPIPFKDLPDEGKLLS